MILQPNCTLFTLYSSQISHTIIYFISSIFWVTSVNMIHLISTYHVGKTAIYANTYKYDKNLHLYGSPRKLCIFCSSKLMASITWTNNDHGVSLHIPSLRWVNNGYDCWIRDMKVIPEYDIKWHHSVCIKQKFSIYIDFLGQFHICDITFPLAFVVCTAS